MNRLDRINRTRDATKAKLAKAMNLLKRADAAEIAAPDKDWFRDLYLLTGEHAVLTDEGWIPGVEKHLVSPDNILDEINAPRSENKR